MADQAHYMDVRLPMGIFFSLCGLVIFAYGLLDRPASPETLLGAPVNLLWGGVIGLFGLLLLAATFRRKRG